MNWSDERYVKLYVRPTATYRLWPWQAKALFPWLLARCDGSGLLEVGRHGVQGVAALVEMPLELVQTAVDALLEDGTIERVPRGFLLPKFIEAQEATKTEKQKKRDQRERARSQAREIVNEPVPECPELSPSVPSCPPPAQPSPAQPSPLTTMSGKPDVSEDLESKLTDSEFQVFEHWRTTRSHQRAKASPERKRLIAKALKTYTVEDLQRAIDGVSKSPHHMGQNDRHTVYDDIELILRDAKRIEGFMALAPKRSA